MLKTGVAAGVHWSRIDRVIGVKRGLDRAPLVLGYHRVVQDFERSARRTMASMLISTRTLEQQLDWVAQRYRFVSMDELGEAISAGQVAGTDAPGGKPMAAVTFDDGYRDVYENAFPLLRRKGIPFAVYVVTDLVGTDRLQLHDELYLRLSEVLTLKPEARAECWNSLLERFTSDTVQLESLIRQVEECADPHRATRLMLHGLSAPQLREALEVFGSRVVPDQRRRQEFLSMDWEMLNKLIQGGVTVGSHTRSHVLLATATEDVVREELGGSRKELEQRLGVPVRHLAYPDGSFNANTLRAVQAAGYETACTTCAHESPDFPALTIPRRLFWERTCMDSFGHFSPSMLSCEVNGVFDARELCNYEH